MSYTTRDIYDYKCFYESTDVIIKYDTVIQHTEDTYTKVIEFQLNNRIHPDSELTLSYEMCGCVAGEDTKAIWYKNGVAYTSEDTVTGNAYEQKTHDITDACLLGDTFSLYTRKVAPQSCVKSKNHRILGTASVFSRPYVYP